MKPATAVIAVVTSAALLSGCGGPPEDASKKDFCAQLKKVNSEKSWSKTKKSVADLKDIGTPKGISKDARTGFEELVGYTDAAKSREALVKKIEKLNKTDRAHLDAFDTYITKTCAPS